MKITYVTNGNTDVEIEGYKSGLLIIYLKNESEGFNFSFKDEDAYIQFIDALKLAAESAYKK